MCQPRLILEIERILKKEQSALLFKTTPYCDASFGSCFKSSFNFDSAAYHATHCKFLTLDRRNIINWCLNINCKTVMSVQ